MASLNFNASTVEPTQSYEPLPEDWYLVIMTKSEMKPTKDGDGAYLETELTVQEGPMKGRKIFYRLNIKNKNPVAQEIAYRQLSAICHAVGVIQVEDSQQLHGLPFKVKVIIRKDESGRYDPSNEVKAIKSANESGGTQPPVGFTPPPSATHAQTAAPVGVGTPPWLANK